MSSGAPCQPRLSLVVVVVAAAATDSSSSLLAFQVRAGPRWPVSSKASQPITTFTPPSYPRPAHSSIFCHSRPTFGLDSESEPEAETEAGAEREGPEFRIARQNSDEQTEDCSAACWCCCCCCGQFVLHGPSENSRDAPGRFRGPPRLVSCGCLKLEQAQKAAPVS